MNLIEKLGLEKCKAIVDGAPDGSECVVISNNGESIYLKDTIFGLAYYAGINCWVVANPEIKKHLIRLIDLRTAIANHTDNLSHFDHCSDIANHISPLTKVTER